MVALAVDLGSRKLGVVVSDGSRELGFTIPVTAYVRLAADELVAMIDQVRAERVVLEMSRGYCGPASDPGRTAARAISVMGHRDVYLEIAVRVMVRCEDRGIPVRVMPAQTWRKLLGMGKDRSDRACRAAVAAVVGEARAGVLADEHQVDALGALLGVLESEAAEARTAARVKRCTTGAPTAAPRPRGPRDQRGRARRKVAPQVAGVPCCKRCGGPRKGHVRGLACPTPVGGA